MGWRLNVDTQLVTTNINEQKVARAPLPGGDQEIQVPFGGPLLNNGAGVGVGFGGNLSVGKTEMSSFTLDLQGSATAGSNFSRLGGALVVGMEHLLSDNAAVMWGVGPALHSVTNKTADGSPSHNSLTARAQLGGVLYVNPDVALYAEGGMEYPFSGDGKSLNLAGAMQPFFGFGVRFALGEFDHLAPAPVTVQGAIDNAADLLRQMRGNASDNQYDRFLKDYGHIDNEVERELAVVKEYTKWLTVEGHKFEKSGVRLSLSEFENKSKPLTEAMKGSDGTNSSRLAAEGFERTAASFKAWVALTLLQPKLIGSERTDGKKSVFDQIKDEGETLRQNIIAMDNLAKEVDFRTKITAYKNRAEAFSKTAEKVVPLLPSTLNTAGGGRLGSFQRKADFIAGKKDTAVVDELTDITIQNLETTLTRKTTHLKSSEGKK